MICTFRIGFTLFLTLGSFLLFGDNVIDINDRKIHIVNLGLSQDTQTIEIQINSLHVNRNLIILKSNFDYLSIEPIYDKSKVYVNGQTVTDKKLLIQDPYPIFPIEHEGLIIVKVFSNEPIILPFQVVDNSELHTIQFQRDVFSSIFIGIIISLLLYNLSLYFVLRDSNYLYYCLYLFFISIAQLDITGFNYYIFSEHTELFNILFHLGSGLSGIFGILFIQGFLATRRKARRGHIFLNVILGVYVIVLALIFINEANWAYQFMELGGVSLIVILFVSSNLAINGTKQGVHVSVSYFVLFIGIFLYTLKDLDIVPFNVFTNYTLTIGVALQAILLSLALADSINILREDSKVANQRAIDQIEKNKELVLNQNVVLEKKVTERTAALQQALDDLKAAQSQLVQSEKMASLGTLTAGIAHEINNPINFVSANVIPLRENIHDITTLIAAYKSIDFSNLKSELKRLAGLEEELELDYMLTETKQLIDGIEEGAKRTHTIVDGLTSFSRGNMVKKSEADINRGIRSTISVLKSRLNNVNLIMDLDNNLPLVSCQVGKINQVVLNLINNALDALEEKNGTNGKASQLIVGTKNLGDSIQIIIGDNANGIDKELQRKIMEPFYTTKDVGKGTGLGLSISYSIIEDHGGAIEIDSEMGVGTKFMVTLPIVLQT
jgi:signal transduction histidine kinase